MTHWENWEKLRNWEKNTVHFKTTENPKPKIMISKAGGVNDTGILPQKVARISRKSQAKVPKDSKKKAHVKESRTAAKEKLSRRSLLCRLFTPHFLKQYHPLCYKWLCTPSDKKKQQKQQQCYQNIHFCWGSSCLFFDQQYSSAKHQICLLWRHCFLDPKRDH